MHNDDIERPNEHATEREADAREGVTAADDTGLISQQVTIVESAIGDAESGSE